MRVRIEGIGECYSGQIEASRLDVQSIDIVDGRIEGFDRVPGDSYDARIDAAGGAVLSAIQQHQEEKARKAQASQEATSDG